MSTPQGGRSKQKSGREPIQRTIRPRAATRHEVMEVVTNLQVLPFDMQDDQDADLGRQESGIRGHLDHGLSGGLDQEAVDLPQALAKATGVERHWEREDRMEVGHVEQVGLPEAAETGRESGREHDVAVLAPPFSLRLISEPLRIGREIPRLSATFRGALPNLTGSDHPFQKS